MVIRNNKNVILNVVKNPLLNNKILRFTQNDRGKTVRMFRNF